MLVSAEEAREYIRCPLAYKNYKNKRDTVIERFLRQSIIRGEQRAALLNLILRPKTLVREWDRIYWPTVQKQEMDLEKAKKLSVKAARLFVKYTRLKELHNCPTIGVHAKNYTSVNSVELYSQADLVKTGQTGPLLVNIVFGKNSTGKQLVKDPIVFLRTFPFWNGGPMEYGQVQIGKTATFERIFLSEKDMQSARKMIEHVTYGIGKKAFYSNLNCKECEYGKVCSG